jgi:putative transposase
VVDEAETNVLACMDFPAMHRAKLHSTNSLEPLNGEVKRRTESWGSSQPVRDDRLVSL